MALSVMCYELDWGVIHVLVCFVLFFTSCGKANKLILGGYIKVV